MGTHKSKELVVFKQQATKDLPNIAELYENETEEHQRQDNNTLQTQGALMMTVDKNLKVCGVVSTDLINRQSSL